MGDQSLYKNRFCASPLLPPKKDAQASSSWEPDTDLGLNMGSGEETTLRIHRSMLQTGAYVVCYSQIHLRGGVLSQTLGGVPFPWATPPLPGATHLPQRQRQSVSRPQRPCVGQLMTHLPQPEFGDLTESRRTRFRAGRVSPPSGPRLARPQASGPGFDPGRNAWVESWVWDRAVFSHI